MKTLNLIYGLKDPRTNKIRYIGLSREGLKRPKSHTQPSTYNAKGKKNLPIYNWIRKLLSLNLRPEIMILIDNVKTEEILCTYEVQLIAKYRALFDQDPIVYGKLLNIADGGRINKKSEAGLQRLRDKNIGKVVTAETREKLRQAKLKNPTTPETAEKIRKTLTGRKRPKKVGEKISQTRLSKKIRHTEETKQLLRTQRLGISTKPHTEETKKKIRDTKFNNKAFKAIQEYESKLKEIRNNYQEGSSKYKTHQRDLWKEVKKYLNKNRERLSTDNLDKIKVILKRKSQVVSDKTREKLREANIGKKISNSSIKKRTQTRRKNGVVAWNKGKKKDGNNKDHS